MAGVGAGAGPTEHSSLSAVGLLTQALLTAARQRAQARPRDLPPPCQAGTRCSPSQNSPWESSSKPSGQPSFSSAGQRGQALSTQLVLPSRQLGRAEAASASVLSQVSTQASASPLPASASAVGHVMRGSRGLARPWLADTEIINKYKAGDRTGKAVVLTTQRRGLALAGVNEHLTGQQARGRAGTDCSGGGRSLDCLNDWRVCTLDEAATGCQVAVTEIAPPLLHPARQAMPCPFHRRAHEGLGRARLCP